MHKGQSNTRHAMSNKKLVIFINEYKQQKVGKFNEFWFMTRACFCSKLFDC